MKPSKFDHVLAFIDAPDPDNFVMLLALAKLNPGATLHVVLTGRPLRFNADRSHALWDWDMESSMMAQQASAVRARNFMRHFGVRIPAVYDGGIAPRTLVPHWVHFSEYYKFGDIDPLAALRHSELDPMEDLIREVIRWKDKSVAVVVGGPMTGLAQMVTRAPDVTAKFAEVHAMFTTWGNVKLMDMGGAPRGAKQFNVTCDPMAAYQILMGLDCPVYLMPTEVTRVSEIGFVNAQALREALPPGKGVNALYALYALWYDAAVRPRQDKDPNEKIFIHDVVGAFSLDPELRASIYEVVPIEIASVPIHPFEGVTDQDRATFAAQGKPVPADLHWGDVLMRETTTVGNRFAATRLKPGGDEAYLRALYDICK